MNYDITGKLGGGDAKPAEPPPIKILAKNYTSKEIQTLLSQGYIGINSTLWDYIPYGAHIRYLRKDVDGKPYGERFKPGGFVKNHINVDGKKIMYLENSIGGQGKPGYVTFPLAYDDVEKLWKKYDKHSFVEMHLIIMSLSKKSQQIDELTARVKVLEDLLKK